MNKVTIITPVYNGSKFLRKSIKSVFDQEYPDIELIVINDGSADDSLSVLYELQKIAPSSVDMRIFSQENQGICRTRNRALDLATGQYIMFMDQDDMLKRKAIATLITEYEQKKADMIIGGYDLLNQDDKVLEKWTLDPKNEWSKFRISAPWGRVYSKDVIEQNHIRFMITKISEDFYFNLVYMSHCQNIIVSEYRGYGWRYSPKSESHANMSQIAEDRNPLVMLSQTLNDMNHNSCMRQEYVDYMMIKHIVWYLLFTAKSATAESLKSMYKQCFLWLDTNIPGYKKNSLIGILSPKGESLKVRSIVAIAIFLKKLNLLYLFLNVYRRI